MSWIDYDNYRDISVLIGKTLTECSKVGDDEIRFVADGETYLMNHSQDCCEHVYIESIVGDLQDLVGEPILVAEESTSDKDPEGYKREYPPDSVTWTFYKFATRKGYVDIRWLGESNGYYSESVSLSIAP